MKIKNWKKLVISVVVCLSVGYFGSLFTSAAIPVWYQSLQKPELSPPNWLFAPVWIILYILMGISAYLIWKNGWNNKDVKIALKIFLLQLVLNSLWSYIFFGLKNPGIALVEIVVLWLTILTTIFYFNKISKTASWLLVPYILWVSFAIYLNYSIFILN